MSVGGIKLFRQLPNFTWLSYVISSTDISTSTQTMTFPHWETDFSNILVGEIILNF